MDENSGCCEIVEKRIKKRDLMKLQRQSELMNGHDLDDLSHFNERRSVNQQLLEKYFPDQYKEKEKEDYPILFISSSNMPSVNDNGGGGTLDNGNP
jgi:hypothetical protein